MNNGPGPEVPPYRERKLIDAKTGAVKKFGVPDIEGFAAGSGGVHTPLSLAE